MERFLTGVAVALALSATAALAQESKPSLEIGGILDMSSLRVRNP